MHSGGEGGLIAIDRYANIVLEFNTEDMYRVGKNAHEKQLFYL
ncbi:MAG: hypothetical protein IPO92_07040 [Saprospiraceae bacterium]|nr:hypothetical protein [Saprospiraceae bacterium]